MYVTPRWLFTTLDDSETYLFPINPNDHTSPIPARSIDWSWSTEGFTGQRAGRTPHPWEFSGVLRSQEQYDAFLSWLNRREKIRLTTDLGQEFIIRLIAFGPSQNAPARRFAPWRFQYTMKVLTFEQLVLSLPGDPEGPV